MLRARIFAVVCLLGSILAFGGTLRLAIAESMWQMRSALQVGNAKYFEQWAERQPELAETALRQAVLFNPCDSAAWIALGLEAERSGDMRRAQHCLLQAEKVDRQYLPAWTSANFFFRQSNFFRESSDAQFWRAAAQAAAMSYDDPAPLIDLADHREPRAVVAIARLGDTPRLERGYLHFLIQDSRWQEAQVMAARLALQHDAQDIELLTVLTDRLLAAGKGDAALAVWNSFALLRTPVAPELASGDFSSRPSGHGFDWRMTAPPGGSAQWEPPHLRFRLGGSTPDACGLLKRWTLLEAGKYRLAVAYRTEGLAEETGLRWVLTRAEHEEAASPVLRRSLQTALQAQTAPWSFRVPNAGLFELQLVYIRVPGTTHLEGSAEFDSVSLEEL